LNNLNSILIEGTMVRDPQYRITPKGTAVCTFSIASNRYFNSDDGIDKEVSFFEIETWARLAESCNSYGKKGRGVRVVGRLKQDRWQGQDGKPHARIMIVAEHVEFRPEFSKTTEADEKNEDQVEIKQDVLPDDEMADETRETEVTAEEMARINE